MATVKDPSIEGVKILMVQPLDADLQPDGGPIAALDTVQAGPDDLVWCILKRESTMALPDPFAPVDASITGIVDIVNKEDVGLLDKELIFDEEQSQ